MPVESAARREEVPHHGRDHQPHDRVLVEARRQLAADVEQVLQLEDLHRQRLVDPAQLLVDEPVLDRRRRAGGEALQEAQLLAPERPALRPRPEPEQRDRSPAAPHGAHEREPGAREPRLARWRDDRRGGRPPRTRAARAPRPGGLGRRAGGSVPALAVGDVERPARDLQLPHHDQQRRVQDLAAGERRAEGRREVEQRDQLGHALEQRRLAPLAPELVERLLVLVDDRRAHGRRSACGRGSGLRLTMQHTLRCGGAAERHRVHDPAHQVHAQPAGAPLARVAREVHGRDRARVDGRAVVDDVDPQLLPGVPEAQLDDAVVRPGVGVLDHVRRGLVDRERQLLRQRGVEARRSRPSAG